MDPTVKNNSIWSDIPGIPETPAPSDTELWLTQAFISAEPILYVVSILAFVACTVLLVIKTKAPGRLLILAGPVLVIVFWIIQKFRNPSFPVSLEPNLFEFVFAKFFVALSVFITIIGYSRLVWWLYRKNRAKHSS